ncbi:DUF3817 domain-containing protein [Luedemannella helvata]|uniref:DUF3817 domain-containing protein n=1 Tax=Luedemannella helvata TaxID=349315 RepID=UPI0031DF0426
MDAALLRFRVAAYVVGVLLLVLVFVAMPLKYLADEAIGVALVGPLHGFLYMGYLAVAFDLAVRARWPIGRTILVLLAGTIPIMSFVAERKVTQWTRQAMAGSNETAADQKVHSAR